MIVDAGLESSDADKGLRDLESGILLSEVLDRFENGRRKFLEERMGDMGSEAVKGGLRECF